jgi:hypothetical protein
MINHDPTVIDHVLLEWLLALSCCNKANSMVVSIFPIMFGKRDVLTDKVCSIFYSGVLNQLSSTVVPTATIVSAKKMLNQNHIDFENTIDTLTIHDIVVSLSAHLGYDASKNDGNDALEVSAEKIHTILRDVCKDPVLTGISNTNGASNLPPLSAYDMLMNDSNIKFDCVLKLRNLINELGIQSSSDIIDLELPEVQRVVDCLKLAKHAAFRRLVI